jgi:branched-chain amino acid transport system substrate-binding protein
MKWTGWTHLIGAAAFGLGLANTAFAQSSVKVGAIYPFSGAAASIGAYAKAAIEVAVDIVKQ